MSSPREIFDKAADKNATPGTPPQKFKPLWHDTDVARNFGQDLIKQLRKQFPNVQDAMWLVKNGAALDATSSMNGETPLHGALRNGFREMIAEMVKHGAPVNAEAKNGHTPLSLAAKNNDTESIKLLLDAGALPNENALVRCISSRNIENIKLLLDAGQPAREYMLAYVESADAREVRDLLQKDLIDRKKNDLHRATTTVRDMTVSKPVRLKPPQNKP
jgi:hypothetical protein